MEGNGERRGSLGRAFLKLRNALRRRGSSIRPAYTTTTQYTSTTDEPIITAPAAPAAVDTAPVEPLKSAGITADVPSAPTVLTTTDVPLIRDTGADMEADDTTEPLLPMLSTRTGLSNERARKLFEKYGIQYQPLSNASEPQSTDNRRRVEKPIRIRIHWTCHDCNSSFGVSKTCTNCGHRRCRECPRSPAKRVRQILETAREQRHEDEQPPAASSEQGEVTNAPVEVRRANSFAQSHIPEAVQPAKLEHDELTSSDDIDPTQQQYVVQHRPRSGVQVTSRLKAHVVRRICHECHSTFKPANGTECQVCGHTCCELCPRDKQKRETSTQGLMEHERPTAQEPMMVATVQRVYRKPRQRVRWICDRCQATYGDRERCRNCGHERCRACTRNPFVS